MARVCDFTSCQLQAVACVNHPAKGEVDVCRRDLRFFEDDEVVRRYD